MGKKGRGRPALAAALIALACPAVSAVARDCDERYFAADDYANAKPLRRPSAKFAQALADARDGTASAQRAVAVSYETGYLVSRCESKAYHWYEKAAVGGDATARTWIERRQALSALSRGDECVGEHCSGHAENRVAMLYADAARSGHFFAPITINGHTVRGLVDTGASSLAMSAETAKAFGITAAGAKAGQASTANGTISTQNLVVPLVDIAGIKLRDVEVSIGVSGETLVGMSVLRRLNVGMTPGTLSLSKR